MAREPAVRERNPWLPLFALAVACLAGSLVALRLGWYTPLAAPLATLLAAIVASRLLGRRPVRPPG